MNDEGRGKREAYGRLCELGAKIVVAQAFPNGFLSARRHAERREILRVVEVTEIPGDRQLEGAPLIGRGVALAQATGTQRVALPLDLRSRHAAGEFFLELAPVPSGDRGGSDERQPFDVVRMFEEVQHGQQAAPGVSTQRQPVQA